MHSPTYKDGNYTKLMQINFLSHKIYRNCIKIHQNDEVQNDVQNTEKI